MLLQVISGFDQHHTKSEIISAIEGIGYPGGGTETGKALLKAKSNLFDKSARAGIPNIAVVITDGKSSDNIGAPAQQLRDSGCTVFSLGVGKNYDMEQLKEIATDPDSQHVLKADFDSLDSSLVDTIVGTACKGMLINIFRERAVVIVGKLLAILLSFRYNVRFSILNTDLIVHAQQAAAGYFLTVPMSSQ